MSNILLFAFKFFFNREMRKVPDVQVLVWSNWANSEDVFPRRYSDEIDVWVPITLNSDPFFFLQILTRSFLFFSSAFNRLLLILSANMLNLDVPSTLSTLRL